MRGFTERMLIALYVIQKENPYLKKSFTASFGIISSWKI